MDGDAEGFEESTDFERDMLGEPERVKLALVVPFVGEFILVQERG